MASWTHRPMDPQTHGPTDPWTHRPMDPWTHGPMDPWTHDPWTHGPMDPWTHGPMYPRACYNSCPPFRHSHHTQRDRLQRLTIQQRSHVGGQPPEEGLLLLHPVDGVTTYE